MPWLQIHITCNAAEVEALEEKLLLCGAVSVTLQDNADQPLLEPGVGETPLWDSIDLIALFDDKHNIEEITKKITFFYPNDTLTLRCEKIQDQDWERAWLDDFKPIQFGKKLWICPSWTKAPAPDAVNVILDPGLAFGTGTHSTTALCLEWLDAAELQGKIIIDYGCGSGILAIAALKLGAKLAIAIDNDPQALTATKNNAQTNAIAGTALICGSPQELTTILQNQNIDCADIVMANILAEPLISLSETLCHLLHGQSDLIMSGILEEQADSVVNAYSNNLHFIDHSQHDQWVRLHGKRKNSTKTMV